MARISASILGFLFDSRKNKESSDSMISRINKALKEKEKDFDILHLDIEDGKFVKYKSFRASELRKIKSIHKKEAHLMVVNYKRYIADLFPIVQMFIFHEEVLKRDFSKTIDFIKKNKKFVGISISPDTHIDEIRYLDRIDLILVMSVYPGLPRQRFIEQTLWKIRKLKELRRKNKWKFAIEVDGGIHKDNMQKITNAGADILVMGSGFFTRKQQN
jgi:ribulose-phosphate 3-epimerase